MDESTFIPLLKNNTLKNCNDYIPDNALHARKCEANMSNEHFGWQRLEGLEKPYLALQLSHKNVEINKKIYMFALVTTRRLLIIKCL